nr:immunoglobulin heavy chain junction region [Macaca mulatta]MOY22615.1 immunoglobulin heavy chain junction region [Macaca mulatta]MOY28090.1 immunoglobulin heavy chain junction region [Macaca mulatta]MOY29184.1 immunoglobulin heavy chain junction region [Macaca mulatta]
CASRDGSNINGVVVSW